MKNSKRTAILLAAITMAAGTARADLLAKSDAVNPIGGYPLWIQDQNAVALQSCFNPALCLLPDGVEQPGFNPNAPFVLPGNFPGEHFFFAASSDLSPTMSVEFAVEGAFNPEVIAPGNQEMFHRLRIVVDPAPVSGQYTVVHPWGITTFDEACVQGDKCQLTLDVNAAPQRFNYDGILGLENSPFTVSTYLVATPNPATNFPPTGYIGDCATATTVSGGVERNSVELRGPSGELLGESDQFVVCGQKMGVEVQPGTSFAFGAVTIQDPAVPSAPQTVTVTNVTGNPITFPALAASTTDFTIEADTCSGETLDIIAPDNTCSFQIAFDPKPIILPETAARTATLVLAPTTVQPDPEDPTLPDPPPVTLNLSGTAQYALTVTVPSNATAGGKVDSSPAGIANCTGPAGTCSAAFNAGSSVTLTPIGAATAPLSLFDAWGGACTGEGACVVTMDATKAVTASFVPAFTVVTSRTPANGGTITATQVSKQASSPQLAISPETCFHIATLTDNGTPVEATPVPDTTASTYTVANVTADRTIAVAFSNQQTITRSPGANGQITGADTVTCGTANTSYSIVPNANGNGRMT